MRVGIRPIWLDAGSSTDPQGLQRDHTRAIATRGVRCGCDPDVPSRPPSDRTTNEPMLYTVLDMAATRTQIYLTAEQRKGLDERRRRDGRTLAEVVREAVDGYLATSGTDPQGALDAAFGTMPDLVLPSRDEWDHGADPDRH